MPSSDDHDRYIEYLQTQLLTPGWEDIFNAQSWAAWYRANSSRFRSSRVRVFDSGTDPVEHLERLATDFQPATRFDLHQTHEIFGPLLTKVQATAETLGLRPVRPV